VHGETLLPVENFKAYPGLGIEGEIDGVLYKIGSARYISADALEERGNATVVYLADVNGIVAEFEIADTLRPEAMAMVNDLHGMSMALHMVSGDRHAAVTAMADKVGIKTTQAETMPEEKAEYIENLQSNGSRVAMVGDGINDAPALTAASIGIGVAKGTDIAMESADIVLMREDLQLIPTALLLARKTFATIRLNLFWALGYNIVALPLAFLGLLHPIICAGAMALSSLCVVGNSLLLKRIARKL
jgi:Cu+-exporting ATPase